MGAIIQSTTTAKKTKHTDNTCKVLCTSSSHSEPYSVLCCGRATKEDREKESVHGERVSSALFLVLEQYEVGLCSDKMALTLGMRSYHMSLVKKKTLCF